MIHCVRPAPLYHRIGGIITPSQEKPEPTKFRLFLERNAGRVKAAYLVRQDEPMEASDTTSGQTIRIFLSSTFRDMLAEREVLVKRVFPELRRRCRDRGGDLLEIDLRWGVTEEQAQQGEVIPLCFAQIERCQPFFLGILGARYGWVPETLSPSLLAQHPWLSESEGMSVTEMEIEHGVLRRAKENDKASEPIRAFFFLREEAYLDTCTEAERAVLLEQSAEGQRRLARLKQSLREGPHPTFAYRDPEALGDIVRDVLAPLIDEIFPPDAQDDSRRAQARAMETYRAQLLSPFVGREEEQMALDQVALSDGPPVVLYGPSGTGKSALIATWSERFARQHPGTFCFVHFIGATEESVHSYHLMERLLLELQHQLGKPESTDDLDNVTLVGEVTGLLGELGARQPCVLVIDGLDRLAEDGIARELAWLPEYWPPNVRVILTTGEGLPWKILTQRRHYPTMQLLPLSPAERAQLIHQALGQYGKALAAKQMESICEADATSKPLFLRVLLEELRVFGQHEALDERLGQLLSCSDLIALYDARCQRMERDYDESSSHNQPMVQMALSLLAASRWGLMESELIEILDIPPLRWSPFFFALQDDLYEGAGMLQFAHAPLYEAISSRYLQEPESQKQILTQLASWWRKQPTTPRTLAEYPRLLVELEAWEELAHYLLDHDVLSMMGHWLSAERNRLVWQVSEHVDLPSLIQSCLQALPTEPEEAISYLSELTGMSDELGFVALVEQLHEHSLKLSEVPEVAHLRFWLHRNIGSFLRKHGRYQEALPHLQKSLHLCDQTSDPVTVARTEGQLAQLYLSMEALEEADRHFQSAINRLEGYGPTREADLELARLYHNFAVLLRYKAVYDKAEEYLRKSVKYRESYLGMYHQTTAITTTTLAALLRECGKHDEAAHLLTYALQTQEHILGPNHPHTAGVQLALGELMLEQGHYGEAEKNLRAALATQDQHFSPNHPERATTLLDLGVLYKAIDELEKAETHYEQAFDIRRTLFGEDSPTTQHAAYFLADIRMEQGELDGVEAAFHKAYEVFTQTLGDESPYTFYLKRSFATLYQHLGKGEQTIHYLREAAEGLASCYGTQHHDYLNVLLDLAYALNAQGEWQQAADVLAQSIPIHDELYGPDHLDRCELLAQRATNLEHLGEKEAALACLEEIFALEDALVASDPTRAAGYARRMVFLHTDLGHWRIAVSLGELLVERTAAHSAPEDLQTMMLLLTYANAQAGDTEGTEAWGARFFGTVGQDSTSLEAAQVWNSLGLASLQRDDVTSAIERFQRSAGFMERELGPTHNATHVAQTNLASALIKQGHFDEADALLCSLQEQHTDPTQAVAAKIQREFAHLRRRQGHPQEALSLAQRALESLSSRLHKQHTSRADFLEELGLCQQDNKQIEAARSSWQEACDIWNHAQLSEHPKYHKLQGYLAALPDQSST